VRNDQGVPITFSDLEFMDKQLHSNLKWLRENKEVDLLCLDFTVRRDTFVGVGAAEGEKDSADRGRTTENGRVDGMSPIPLASH
jgi:hypothetical protein